MNNYSGLSLFFLTGSTVAMRKVQSIFLIEGGTYSCSTREGKKIYGTESNVSPRLLFVWLHCLFVTVSMPIIAPSPLLIGLSGIMHIDSRWALASTAPPSFSRYGMLWPLGPGRAIYGHIRLHWEYIPLTMFGIRVSSVLLGGVAIHGGGVWHRGLMWGFGTLEPRLFIIMSYKFKVVLWLVYGGTKICNKTQQGYKDLEVYFRGRNPAINSCMWPRLSTSKYVCGLNEERGRKVSVPSLYYNCSTTLWELRS